MDKRWRIEQVPIDYRDRPEGSESKLSTFSDGIKVLRMIFSLFKDYRPLPFFNILALIFCILGLFFGVPVIVEFSHTGLVPRLPTAVLAAVLMVLAALFLSCGIVLDTEVKASRRAWELEVMREYEEEHARAARKRARERRERESARTGGEEA